MDENSCFKNVNVLEGSSTPMDWALAHLHETMAKITAECTTCANIELCDHATSLLQGVASNIHHLCLVGVNESMHSRMVFCWMDDGFRNYINQMKDWHGTMMEHLNTFKKWTSEQRKAFHLYPYSDLIYVWLKFHFYLTLYTFH
jgi:hypothetical protein